MRQQHTGTSTGGHKGDGDRTTTSWKWMTPTDNNKRTRAATVTTAKEREREGTNVCRSSRARRRPVTNDDDGHDEWSERRRALRPAERKLFQGGGSPVGGGRVVISPLASAFEHFVVSYSFLLALLLRWEGHIYIYIYGGCLPFFPIFLCILCCIGWVDGVGGLRRNKW